MTKGLPQLRGRDGSCVLVRLPTLSRVGFTETRFLMVRFNVYRCRAIKLEKLPYCLPCWNAVTQARRSRKNKKFSNSSSNRKSSFFHSSRWKKFQVTPVKVNCNNYCIEYHHCQPGSQAAPAARRPPSPAVRGRPSSLRLLAGTENIHPSQCCSKRIGSHIFLWAEVCE